MKFYIINHHNFVKVEGNKMIRGRSLNKNQVTSIIFIIFHSIVIRIIRMKEIKIPIIYHVR